MDKAAIVLETILSRRSIRRYTDQKLTREQIEALLDAAMAAPSANNRRPWHFVVVQEVARRKALSQVHRWAHMIEEAPVAIAVCAESNGNPFWIDDCSAATENILLAAQAMGLGGVWIGIHPTASYQAAVREILHLPMSIGVHCLLAIGYPAERRPAYSKHDPTRVHWERWE
ncbi:MAG: nitroreductase family protein [Anaerolineae bacterium]